MEKQFFCSLVNGSYDSSVFFLMLVRRTVTVIVSCATNRVTGGGQEPMESPEVDLNWGIDLT